MNIVDNVYSGLLKVFDSFDGDHCIFTYNNCDERNVYLREKYHLLNVAGNGDTLKKATRIMKWLFAILLHDPDYVNSPSDNALVLLEYLEQKKPINCRATATILTECLLSLDVPARSVWLMPFNPYDTDCHVVTVAYCKELEKWVMLDATVNTIVRNEEGVPLDPIEIRDIIKEKGRLFFSDELWYYRLVCAKETHQKGYYNYLAKNTFYFMSYIENRFGYEAIQSTNEVYCIPNLFCPSYERGLEIKTSYNMRREYEPKLCSKGAFMCSPMPMNSKVL